MHVESKSNDVFVKNPSNGTISFINKKQSWSRFFTKLVLICAPIFIACYVFFSRYSFAYEPAIVRCLPEYSFFIVDHMDRSPARNALFAFQSKDLRPMFPLDQKMIKIMKGMPGDNIEINAFDQIFINGTPDSQGLMWAKTKLGREPASFRGKVTLKSNEYWMLGTAAVSFDSRYWGSIGAERIIGRAYPLF